MFEFKVKLDDNDYVEFNKHCFLNSPSKIKGLKTYKLIGPVMFFLIDIAMGLWYGNLITFLITLVFSAIGSIYWVSISEKMYLKSVENNINEMKKDGKLPYNNEESIIKFDDDIVHETSQSIDCKTKYTYFEKINITEKYVFIFNSGASAYMIPVTVFSNKNEKERFLEFINSKVGNK